MSKVVPPLTLMLAAAACSSAPDTTPAPAPATLIVNATVLDGTGAEGRAASVRIEGDRIVAVGTVKARADEHVVDGTGLVLARLLERRVDHRVQGRIEALDASDRCVHQLLRRDFPLPHQLRLGGRIEPSEVVRHEAAV